MGVLQTLFGSTKDMPGYQQTGIDQPTQDSIGQQEAQAKKSVEDLRAEKLVGTSTAEQRAAPIKQLSSFNSQLGMASPMQLNEAMVRRQERSYGSELERLKRLSEPEAFQQKAKAINVAAQSNKRRSQIEMEVAEGMRNADAQKKKARNEMIGSMLGAVGTVAGAVIGGPMGASAGNQAGQAVGGAATRGK